MFIGEYQHSLDDKGRLFMPAKFREELGPRFIVTRGFDHCLFAFPLNTWQSLNEQMQKLSLGSPEARAFLRLFFAGAAECEVDRQGRVLLPPYLREHAHLQADCAVIGVSNRVEIWDRALWESFRESAAETYESIAEKLIGTGL